MNCPNNEPIKYITNPNKLQNKYNSISFDIWNFFIISEYINQERMKYVTEYFNIKTKKIELKI